MADENKKENVEPTPKEQAKIDREKIEVTVSKATEDDNDNEIEKEEIEEKKEDETEEVEKEAKEVDEKTDEIKDEVDEKSKKQQERFERRLSKEVAKRKELETRLNEAITRLESKKEDGEETYTRADAEKLGKQLALQEQFQRDFDNACIRLQEGSRKIDKTFDTKVKVMADELGPIPTQMIGVLDDLENGPVVLNHLVNNIDDAETIYKSSPAKMALELAKLSTKLTAKKEVRAISKVPNPNDTLGGNNKGSTTTLSDKDDMDTWMQKRNEQVKKSRENGRYNLR